MISVIFDMDGTLLDTQRIWVDAWEYAGRIQGVSGMGGYLPDVCGTNDAGSTKYLVDNFKEIDAKKFKEDASFYAEKRQIGTKECNVVRNRRDVHQHWIGWLVRAV